MRNTLAIAASLCILLLALSSCSGTNPLSPNHLPTHSTNIAPSQTHLWGLYDIYIDTSTHTISATPNRQAMFTANVVNFINPKPANLKFKINDTPVGAGYIDVDIDVTIVHPFPGLHQYDGYDVRGIFMGNGSGSLKYNPELKYPILGTDQFMLPDPDDTFGGPDGYTRWFNKPEFSNGGMPLVQYTQGKLATPGYNESATLNPYKYFADGLGVSDNLWTWLGTNAETHGVFSAGASNTRNYYLRFPTASGVKYSYAVIADWDGPSVPTNAPEAVAVNVTDNSDLYYVDSSTKGGNMNLDLGVWDWDSTISAGIMDDYRIFVDSTVLTTPVELNASQMTPVGGDAHYSTYHVELTPDNISGNSGNEYWVIVEQKNHDYTNTFGVTNLADTDPLAAYFRYDLDVSSNPPVSDPICDLVILDPVPVNGSGGNTPVHFDASGSTDPDGGTLSFSWDFDGDGTFGDTFTGTPDKPTHIYPTDYDGQVCVRVSNGSGGQSECCQPLQVITIDTQLKNIPLRSDSVATDLAVDPNNGSLLVVYADEQVWKYFPATGYAQSGATHFFTAWDTQWCIDISQKSNSVLGGTGMYLGASNWDEFGVQRPGDLWGNNQMIWFGGPIRDCGNFPGPDGVGYANNPVVTFGMMNYLSMFFQDNYPDFNNWTQWIINTGPILGYDHVDGNLIRGFECINEDTLWAVETSDLYAASFYLEGVGSWASADFHYDGSYCGTGAQTDSDIGFWDPQDLTVNVQNKLMILDKLSNGSPKIKVFEMTGEPAASIGTFGDTTSISGTPLRLESSPYVDPTYGNLVFVLHGNTAPSMLSIFLPSEIP
jgi:hypothetical protein